jgi:hypothetical protein
MALDILTPNEMENAPIMFQPDCLYLVCRDQGDMTVGNLMFVDVEGLEWDVDGVWGISGMTYSHGIGYGVFGVMVDYVIGNFTIYLRRRWAATRIQRAWQRARRHRAATIIQRAWGRWNVKKDELWNPKCFVGVAFLALDAVRAVKDAAW